MSDTFGIPLPRLRPSRALPGVDDGTPTPRPSPKRVIRAPEAPPAAAGANPFDQFDLFDTPPAAATPDPNMYRVAAGLRPEPPAPIAPRQVAPEVTPPPVETGNPFDQFDPSPGVGEYLEEGGKGVVRGAGGIVTTAVGGGALFDPMQAESERVQAFKDDLKRVPDMTPEELSGFRTRVNELPPGSRTSLQSAISDLLDGSLTPEEVDEVYPASAISDHPLYKLGEDLNEALREALPVSPGWEDSLTVAVGEGLGSVIGGAATSWIAGPIAAGALFTGAGAGESLERAIQYDKEEREAGRPGLTPQQISMAGLYGMGPGATDLIPVEILLSNLRVPKALQKPLAAAIGRIGGQVFVEGVQEGGQEFLQNLIAQQYNEDQTLFENVPGSAGIGGAVGGIAELPVEIARLFTPRRARSGITGRGRNQPPPDPQEVADAAPAGETTVTINGETATSSPRPTPIATPSNVQPGPPPAEPPPPPPPAPPAPAAPAGEASVPAPTPEEIAILRSGGWADEDIAAMGVEERAQEIEDIQRAAVPGAAPTPADPAVPFNPPTPPARPENATPPAAPVLPMQDQPNQSAGPAVLPPVPPAENAELASGTEGEATTSPDVQRETVDTSAVFDTALDEIAPAAPAQPAGDNAPAGEGVVPPAADDNVVASKEVETEDSGEPLVISLTKKGPWDFNDTFPAPDPELVRGLIENGRYPFQGANGEITDPEAPDPEEIAGVLGETLNELTIRHLDIAEAQRQIAEIEAGTVKLKRGQKAEDLIKRLKASIVQDRQALRGTQAELMSIFDRDAVAGIMREARQSAERERGKTRRTPKEDREPEKAKPQDVLGAVGTGTKDEGTVTPEEMEAIRNRPKTTATEFPPERLLSGKLGSNDVGLPNGKRVRAGGKEGTINLFVDGWPRVEFDDGTTTEIKSLDDVADFERLDTRPDESDKTLAEITNAGKGLARAGEDYPKISRKTKAFYNEVDTFYRDTIRWLNERSYAFAPTSAVTQQENAKRPQLAPISSKLKGMAGAMARYMSTATKAHKGHKNAKPAAVVREEHQHVADLMQEIAELKAAIDGTEAPAAQAKERKPRTHTPGVAKGPQDVLSFLIANGGIKPNDETRAMELHKVRPNLVRKDGMEHDHAREILAEAGYFKGTKESAVESTTTADFYTLLNYAAGGEKHYSTDDDAEVAENAANAQKETEREVAERDFDEMVAELDLPGDDALRAAAVDIMLETGDGAEAAYEAAVMQTALTEAPEDYGAVADDIPGWTDEELAAEVATHGERAGETSPESEAEGEPASASPPESTGPPDGESSRPRRKEGKVERFTLDELFADNGVGIAKVENKDGSAAELIRELRLVARRAANEMNRKGLTLEEFRRLFKEGGLNERGPGRQEAMLVAEAADLMGEVVAEADKDGNVPSANIDEETGEPEGDGIADRVLQFLENVEAQGVPLEMGPYTGTYDSSIKPEPKPEDEIFPELKGKPLAIDTQVGKEFVTPEEAAARLETWKDIAKQIGEEKDNSRKVIISMFDYTGTWSQPWRDAGYTVIQQDIKAGADMLNSDWVWNQIEEMRQSDLEVVGVLSACPCTTFTAAANRWRDGLHVEETPEAVAKVFGEAALLTGAKSPKEYNIMLVDATKDMIRSANPSRFHVLENPIGTIRKEGNLPQPAVYFQPNNFGDPYTKRTQLFGDFKTDMPTANVRPVDGSKIHKIRGDSPLGKVERSMTPTGFAYAFFVANDPDAAAMEKKAGFDRMVDALQEEAALASPGGVPAPTTEKGADNKDQTVLPGAEKASDATMAQKGADSRLKPKVPQKSADVGLFGDEANQTDMMDMIRSSERADKIDKIDKIEDFPNAKRDANGNLTETIEGVATYIRPDDTGGFKFKSATKQTLEWDAEGFPSRTETVHAGTREEYVAQLREAQARNPNNKPDTSAIFDEALDEVAPPEGPRQGKVGMMLQAGEVVLTSTGRETTPFPNIDNSTERKAINAVKRVNRWLMQNAIDEATARGDNFNATGFKANLEKPSQADKDSAEHYLFDPDFVLPVPKPLLKPLVDREKIPVEERAAIPDAATIDALKEEDLVDLFRAQSTGEAFDDLRVAILERRPELGAAVLDAIEAAGGRPVDEEWSPRKRSPEEVARDQEANAAKGRRLISHLEKGGQLQLTTHLKSWVIRHPEMLRVAKNGDVQMRAGKTWNTLLTDQVDQLVAQLPKESAKSAVKNTAMGIADVAKGLDALFSPKGKLGSGPTFDEETYRKALPYFKAGAAHFAQAGRDIAAMIRELVRYLHDTAGMDRETIQNMKPYVLRFVDDVEAGKETIDAPSARDGVEPDSGAATVGDDVGAGNVPATGGSTDAGSRAGGKATGGRGQRAGGGRRLPQSHAPVVGEGGNLELPERESGPRGGNPTDRDGDGSRGDGVEGLHVERPAAEEVVKPPAERASLEEKRKAQAAAETLATVPGLESVRADLPFLYPEQQEDVHKAEQRFEKPDGHGMLFTHGTGIGKSYLGLGLAKRFVKRGKTNILIVAPSQGLLTDLANKAPDLLLSTYTLSSTQDAGKGGITLTTYANFGENKELATRNWDLIITDEAHNLSANQQGDTTAALRMLRALTMHPDGLMYRAQIVPELRAEYERMEAIDPKTDSEKRAAAYFAWKEKADVLIDKWKQEQRNKVLFMSATPFAHHFSLDYAEGYLFDYGPRKEGGTSYNEGDARSQFYMQNFGYRMRYNKLTKPESDVAGDVMERQFHEKLKAAGALTGRRLEIPFDYDRKFVLVDDPVGQKIDDILKFLHEADDGKFRSIADEVGKKFDYLSRMKLLEAIKAKQVVPLIKKSHAIGRKVVVFHQYNVGGGFNPFDLEFNDEDTVTIYQGGDISKPTKIKLKDLYAEFLARNPEALKLKFADYLPPISELKRAFPDALFYNGLETAKTRDQNKAKFNDEGPDGANLIVIQADAGGAGISVHDVVGKHQRVLFNIGIPVKPVTAIQQEGRIYRDGQASDAIFRYLNTGTNWERWTFAGKMAERTGTAENLALGNLARGLRQSFVDAFSDSDHYTPGPEDGKGGKEIDRALAADISEFDKAKSHYFAQQKNKRRRDQREGIDYFATPEPLGFKMVEWANLKPREHALEPSAGHGAIARYLPDDVHRTIVEPSSELASRAALLVPGARALVARFEDLHISNKYDAIVMNPPFGSGGKTAYEHVAKAVKHLANGGRIVALVPRGPAADKRWKAFLESPEGNLVYQVATIGLPQVTFERAGTSVSAKVIVLEKNDGPRLSRYVERDYSNAETIEEFFDRIEDATVPDRVEPVAKEEIKAAPKEAKATEAPIEEVSAPAVKGINFDTGETVHGKTGDPLFVASFRDRVPRDAYLKVKTVALKHDGYWSSFRGRGAIPGFQFPSEEKRAAFLAEMGGTPSQEPMASLAPAGETRRERQARRGLTRTEIEKINEIVRRVSGKRPIYPTEIALSGRTEGWGEQDAEFARGEFSPALDSIRISMRHGGPATGYHESFHRLQLFFLNEQERAALAASREDLKNVIRASGKKFDVDQMSGLEIEAEAFAIYATTKDATGVNKIPAAVRQLWDRILELVNATRSYLAERGLQSWQDVFDDAYSGKIALREKANPRNYYPPKYQIAEEPAFQDWFGESKVVDENGKPLVVYHHGDFDETVSIPAEGMHFGTAEAARQRPYGRMVDEAAMAVEAYQAADGKWHWQDDGGFTSEDLDLPGYSSEDSAILYGRAEVLKNIEGSDEAAEDYGNMTAAYLNIENPKYTRDLGGGNGEWEAAIAQAKAEGHDGIGYINQYEDKGSRSWIAFKPTQIKSVNNRGTFDRNNPDILASRGEASARQMRNPTSIEERARIANNLRSIVSRIAGRTVNVEFVRSIPASAITSIDYERDYGPGTPPPTYSGVYFPEGSTNGEYVFAEPLILLSMSERDPMTVAGHEAWHHLYFNMLTDEEHRILAMDLARGEDSTIRRYAALEDADTASMAASELTAFAFQRYRRLKEEGAGTGLHIGVRRIFEKLARMLRQIKNMLARRGYSTVDDIFEGARTGAIANRAPAPVPSAAASAAAPSRQRPQQATAPMQPGTSYYRDRVERFLAGVSHRFDLIRRKMQDQDIFMLRLEEDIESVLGRALPTNLKTWLASSLYTGRAGERQVDLRERFLEPLLDEMHARNVSREALDEYLMARHAQERNAFIRTQRDPNNQSGSGMTDQDAQAILNRVHNGPQAGDFRFLAGRIDALNKQTRRTLLQAGLISQELYDAWDQQYQFYVPLRGWEVLGEENDERPKTGKGYSTRGKEAKPALGRESVSDSPLAYSILQAEQAIIRAEKNRVAKTILRLVRAFPDPTLWKVTQGRLIKTLNANGLVVHRWQHPSADWTNDKLFGVKVNGKQLFIDIEHDDFRRAVQRLGVGGIGFDNPILNFIWRLSRFFAATRTQFDPEFIVSNFFRDLDTAMVNMGDIEGRPRGLRRKAMAEVLKNIREIYKTLRDPNRNTPTAQAWHRYRMSGGKVSFLQWNDISEIKRQMEKDLKRGHTRGFFRGLFRLISDVNTAVENGVRLSVFMNLENVVGQDKAALEARELTVNFNRHGEWGPAVNMLYVFANAGIQGVFRMGRAFAKSKNVRRVVYGLMAYGFIMDFINAWLSDDDEQGRNKYDGIPFWQKERNFILMVPGSEEGLLFMKPAAYGYNLPMVIGQQLASVLRGATSPGEAAANVGGTAFNTFNPLGSAPDLLQYLTPSLLDPIAQIYTNKTWFGGNLAPPQFDKRKPDSENIGANDSEWAIVAARELNALFGGNVGKKSSILGIIDTDVSPATIDLWADFVTGGVGRFVSNIVETGDAAISGREINITHVPFARRVVGKAGGTPQLWGRFYNAWDEANAAYYEVDQLRKSGEEGQAERRSEQNEELIELYVALKPIKGQLDKIRRAKRQIGNDRELTSEERREQIEELDEATRDLLIEADRLVP